MTIYLNITIPIQFQPEEFQIVSFPSLIAYKKKIFRANFKSFEVFQGMDPEYHLHTQTCLEVRRDSKGFSVSDRSSILQGPLEQVNKFALLITITYIDCYGLRSSIS